MKMHQKMHQHKIIDFQYGKIIAKTPVFLSKTGVFLVAEVGLEPTTSGL